MKPFLVISLVSLALVPVVAATTAKQPPPRQSHIAKTYTSLIDAVKANDLPAVRLKLKQGADVNGADDDGLAPLDFATSPIMIRFLRAHGASYGIASSHFSAQATESSPHPKSPVPEPLPIGLRTEDTIAFFKDFTQNHPIPERSQFETAAEYQARLGPDLDKSKVYYFAVDTGIGESTNFKYDLDSKVMTVIGGSEELVSGHTQSDSEPDDVTSIELHETRDDQGEYDAQTAGGAQIKVGKSTFTDYDLDFCNAADWPASVYDAADDKYKRHFSVSFMMEPKPAEELSRHMRMVLAVTLLGYPNSGSRYSYHHKPTFDEPDDNTSYVDWVEAKLVGVSVWDTETKKLVAQVLVPPPSAPSAKPLPPGLALPSDVLRSKDNNP